MLADVGAHLSMIVSTFEFADVRSTDRAVLDLSRIAKTTIPGIAFPGAGALHRAIERS